MSTKKGGNKRKAEEEAVPEEEPQVAPVVKKTKATATAPAKGKTPVAPAKSAGHKRVIEDSPPAGEPTQKKLKFAINAKNPAAALEVLVVDDRNKDEARKILSEKLSKGSGQVDYADAFNWRKVAAGMAGWWVKVEDAKNTEFTTHKYTIMDAQQQEVNIYSPPMAVAFVVMNGLGVLGGKTASDSSREYKMKLTPRVMLKSIADADPSIPTEVKDFALFMAAAGDRIGDLLWECDAFEQGVKSQIIQDTYDTMLSALPEDQQNDLEIDDPKVIERAKVSWLRNLQRWDDDVDDSEQAAGKGGKGTGQQQGGNKANAANKSTQRQRPKKRGVDLRIKKKVFSIIAGAVDVHTSDKSSNKKQGGGKQGAGTGKKSSGPVKKTNTRVEDMSMEDGAAPEGSDANVAGAITEKNSMGLVTDEKLAISIIKKVYEQGFQYSPPRWKDATAKNIDPAKGESAIFFSPVGKGDFVQVRFKFHPYRLNSGLKGISLNMVGYGVLFCQGIMPGSVNAMKPIESPAAMPYVRPAVQKDTGLSELQREHLAEIGEEGHPTANPTKLAASVGKALLEDLKRQRQQDEQRAKGLKKNHVAQYQSPDEDGANEEDEEALRQAEEQEENGETEQHQQQEEDGEEGEPMEEVQPAEQEEEDEVPATQAPAEDDEESQE